MHLNIAFAFALLSAAVEALPLTESNTKLSEIAAPEKRQLSQTKTIQNNDIITVSKSQGTTHDNVGYSWEPVASNEESNSNLNRRQLAKSTGQTTQVKDGYAITTSYSQGTTGDRKGFSWKKADGVLRR